MLNKQNIKANKLLTIYKDKLIKFINNNKLDDSPNYVLNCILSADPDIIGKNSKWLINNTLNGNILWEDIESGENSKSYDTLSRFMNIRKQFDNDKLRDINQFKRLGDIAQQLRDYEVIQSNKSIKNEEKQQIYSETEFLSQYNENGYLVVFPKTERASCFWGLGTTWCTAATYSENRFNYYNNKSPLYICINPRGRKYQFHEDSEPMDENNKEVNNITDPILRKLALITGKIDSVKEKNYNNEYEAKLLCKYNGENIQHINKLSLFYNECCKLAVQQNGLAIEYIDSKLPYYEELCRIAVQQNVYSIKYINNISLFYEELCKLAIKQNKDALQFIAINYQSISKACFEKICFMSVKSNSENIRYISLILNYIPFAQKICYYSLSKDKKNIQYIPSSLPFYNKLYSYATIIFSYSYNLLANIKFISV